MDFYWIYDLPNWLIFTLITLVSLFFSVGGQFIFAPILKRLKVDHDQHNEMISFYLATLGVFYGITLGLVAVGAWETYSDIEANVSDEAACVASLYRDVSYYPNGKADTLKGQLKKYTEHVIQVAWPLQKNGIMPLEGTKLISIFQKTLYSFNPSNNGELVIHQEAMKQFNKLVELRRKRLDSIQAGLPAILWMVLIVGAILNIALCWLFLIPNLTMHVFLNTVVGLLLASLLFLIVALDNPYRGEFSIGPDSIELVYQSLMLN
jgi:hypothetical protein